MAVIPTVAQVQGLAAMAVHEPTADFDSAVVAMSSAAGHARHGAVTIAESSAMTMAGRCEPGDVLGVVEGDFVEIGASVAEVAWRVIERLLSAGGELLTLVRGAGAEQGAGRRADRAAAHAVARWARRRGAGRRPAPLPAAAGAGMSHLRLGPVALAHRHLPAAVDPAGERPRRQDGQAVRAAEDLAPSATWCTTCPAATSPGTELSDLSAAARRRGGRGDGRGGGRPGVQHAERLVPVREEAPARGDDHRPQGQPDLHLLRAAAADRLLAGQLHPGARGIFAGKVKEFNRKLQLAHPDFVIVDESGAIIGGAAAQRRPGAGLPGRASSGSTR